MGGTKDTSQGMPYSTLNALLRRLHGSEVLESWRQLSVKCSLAMQALEKQNLGDSLALAVQPSLWVSSGSVGDFVSANQGGQLLGNKTFG